MSDPNPSYESPLDKAIADVLAELDVLNADSKEFAAATDQLVKLHKLKMDEESACLEHLSKTHEMAEAFRPKPMSRDTLALAGANLLGIALIIWHERDHLMNKNALGFIKTLR